VEGERRANILRNYSVIRCAEPVKAAPFRSGFIGRDRCVPVG